MSADQSIQSVSIDAYERIDGTCSLSQAIQSVSVDSFLIIKAQYRLFKALTLKHLFK